MNNAVVLAVMAGVAVAFQITVNTVGLRILGTGALIGISGATTGVAGLLVAMLLSKPQFTPGSVLCALASGILGAFIVGSITIAASRAGVAQTLSLVLASQLILGLAIDKTGLLGPDFQEIGLLKVLGVALVLIGGILVVRY